MDLEYIDKPALVEVKDGRILVARKKGAKKFYIPGGKRESKSSGEKERDEESLMREILEELQVKIKLETIKFFGVFEGQADNKPEGTIVKMTCYTAEYEGVPKPGGEIEEIQRFDYTDRDKVGLTGQLIMDYLKAKEMLEGSMEGNEVYIEAARERIRKEIDGENQEGKRL